MDDDVDRLICSSRSDGSFHSGHTSGGAGRSSLQFGWGGVYVDTWIMLLWRLAALLICGFAAVLAALLSGASV